MKLARQAEDRRARQYQLGDEHVRHVIEPEDRCRAFGRFGRDSGRAVTQQRPGEHADRDECAQFHDRFECNREHQAVVVLGDVDLACSEQDGEYGECRGEHESGVVFRGTRGRVIGHDIEAGDDGFQLQGDIGNRTDRGYDGDQHGEAARLAVTRRDEVGDRGEVLALAHRDDAVDHPPAEKDDDHRAEVDRHIAPAALGGRAHRAVERPGRTVHGEGQAVDRRTRGAGKTARVRLVTPVRDREQERDVAQRQQQQRPPADQRSNLPSFGFRRPYAGAL